MRFAEQLTIAGCCGRAQGWTGCHWSRIIELRSSIGAYFWGKTVNYVLVRGFGTGIQTEVITRSFTVGEVRLTLSESPEMSTCKFMYLGTCGSTPDAVFCGRNVSATNKRPCISLLRADSPPIGQPQPRSPSLHPHGNRLKHLHHAQITNLTINRARLL
jgi:hypothetical protein